MPSLKNNRHEKFCLEYLGGKSGQEAATDAGYSPHSARVTASKLLAKVSVNDRITELQKEIAGEKIMTVRQRKEYLSEIARGRISNFMGMDASGIRVKTKPEMSNSAALQELNVREIPQSNGGTLVITSIKLHDPVKAIAELNRMERIYDDKPNMTVPIQINYVEATPENAEELQRLMLENKNQ